MTQDPGQVIEMKDRGGGAASRKRILDAALRCFARRGFHTTSMQEICTEAGMSPGGVYRHFPSKDHIIEAIAEVERQHNSQLLGQLDVERDILRTLLDTAFAYLRGVSSGDWGNLCCEALSESRRNPRIRAIFQRNHEEARRALRRALEHARAQGEIDSALDLDVTVATLMALGDGLIVRMPFEPDMTPERMEPVLRDLIQRMLRPTKPSGK